MPKSILIFNDTDGILEVFTDMIRLFGHHPIPERNPSRVVEAVKCEMPNLIILDLCYDLGYLGLSLLDEIRNTPGCEEIPVIFTSAFHPDQDFSEVVLPTPIDLDVFENYITQYV